MLPHYMPRNIYAKILRHVTCKNVSSNFHLFFISKSQPIVAGKHFTSLIHFPLCSFLLLDNTEDSFLAYLKLCVCAYTRTHIFLPLSLLARDLLKVAHKVKKSTIKSFFKKCKTIKIKTMP